MAELSPRQRLLNLQSFINEKIGQNLDLTEGVKVLVDGYKKSAFDELSFYVKAENGAVVLETTDDFALKQSDVAIDEDDYIYWVNGLRRLIISQPQIDGFIVERILESRFNILNNGTGTWVSFGGSNSTSGMKMINNSMVHFYANGRVYYASLTIPNGIHDVKLVSNFSKGDTWYIDGVEIYHHDADDSRYASFVQYKGDICLGQNQSSYGEQCSNKIHDLRITTKVLKLD